MTPPRSKFKGLDQYIVQQVLWAPGKVLKAEKIHKELKCEYRKSQQWVWH